MGTHVLEINLISAQGLKEPSVRSRRMRTYALVWVDQSKKLQTQIDRIGSDNPTWNDKFLFKVTPEFLQSETSAVAVEIYSVGLLRDSLIGSVRFLIGNFLPLSAAASATVSAMKTPCFTALQIRHPSGMFYGVLNVAGMVIDGSDIPALNGVSAIGYRDLVGKIIRENSRRRVLRKSKSAEGEYSSGGSKENPFGDTSDQSDGAESTASPSSTALKDWNRLSHELAGKNRLRSASDGGGMLCGLMRQRRTCLTWSDPGPGPGPDQDYESQKGRQ